VTVTKPPPAKDIREFV